MSPRKFLHLISIASVGFCFLGCHKHPEPMPAANIMKDYDKQLPPGASALRLVDPSQHPNFGEAWFTAKGTDLRESVNNSLHYLAKPSSKSFFPLGPVTHERAVESLKVFLSVLDQASSPEALNQLIRDNFDVYMSVGCDDEGAVLFTGYYAPIFDGSKTQTEKFKVPLYKLPPDLKKDDKGDPIGGPYKTREEIEKSGSMAGNEIAWVADRFEAYVITVQGSGFLRLEDGSLYELGYAGHNGHEYTQIGRSMIADGKIDRFKLSLDTLIRYFKEHPEDLDKYLYQNKRYVFFQDSKGGPYGCLAEKVTPFHSIATDKDIFPRACLAFLSTRIPHVPGESMRTFKSFLLDQDRGAAIRAPGRCDIYMGVGDAAGKMAGYTFNEGRLYYLFVKEGAKPGAEKVAGVPNETVGTNQREPIVRPAKAGGPKTVKKSRSAAKKQPVKTTPPPAPAESTETPANNPAPE